MIPILLLCAPSLECWTGNLADLVGDIQRYLNDEPIEPRPRTWLTDCPAFTGRRDRCLRKTRASARTCDPACRILRVVTRLFGNLDEARSTAAVRPVTTRKLGVRYARPGNP